MRIAEDWKDLCLQGNIKFNSATYNDWSVIYVCDIVSFFQLLSYEPQADDNTLVKKAMNA